MYITLEQAKKHLNIDDYFTDDDNYIEALIAAVHDIVEIDVDAKLTDFENEDGDIPNGLKQGMLLLIGQLYANREPVAFASLSELPLSYRYIMDIYHDYKINI